jgi:hypothetical protein
MNMKSAWTYNTVMCLLLALIDVKIGEQDSAIILSNDSDIADFTYYVIFTW